MAGHQTRARVVLGLNDGRRPLRQHFGYPRMVQVEVLRARRIEQREHPHDPFRRMPHGACQYLIGCRHVARDLGDVIDHDGALLQLHPGGQMLLRALQRLARHRMAASRQGQRDVLVGHPQGRKDAAHAFEPGFQDEAEFIRIARGRRLMRGYFHHEIEVALAHVQIPLSGAQFRAQRQFAAQAFQGRLHQLAHGLDGTRLALRAGEPRNQADDAEHLDFFATYGEGVGSAVGIERPHDAGIFRGIGQRVGEGVRDHGGLVGEVPLVRRPYQIREAVMHHDSAQARHEHSQQTAIGLERRVRGGTLGGGRLHLRHCGHPSLFED